MSILIKTLTNNLKNELQLNQIGIYQHHYDDVIKQYLIEVQSRHAYSSIC